MKVAHICVGTRGNSVHNIAAVLMLVTLTVSTWHLKTTVHIVPGMNRKQTANIGKNAYKLPQLIFLTRQNHSNQSSNCYPNSATFAWLRMPYTVSMGWWRHFQNTTKTRSENCQKLEILPYNVMANFPENIAGIVLRIIECISKLFARVHHCFSHFTVGSSKTRQIMIRGHGLNTTNHDMRPIGLIRRRRLNDAGRHYENLLRHNDMGMMIQCR